MGSQATARVTVNGKQVEAKVHLETSVLHVRAGDVKLDVPFKEMTSVATRDGMLSFGYPGGRVTLALGIQAAKWADKIANPPSRLAKIGVKPGWRVSVVGGIDDGFLNELRGVANEVSVGRARKNSDAIFLALVRPADLDRIAALRGSLKPDGALWTIRRKGDAAITERGVMTAGKAAGLVDVKVVAFSETHTAEKFVIPLKDRQRA